MYKKYIFESLGECSVLFIEVRNMSNVDRVVLDNELFDSLKASVESVEGGATLFIGNVEAITAGADDIGGGGDDIYFLVNGIRVRGSNQSSPSTEFFTGDVKNIGLIADFNNFASVQIYDDDGGVTQDDLIGTFFVTSASPNGNVTLSGSGSTYRVNYEIIRG